jgi:hypothetical protein
MQRLRRAVNIVQQMREARPEEPESLLALLPPTFDVRFLAFAMSWTTKSRRRGGRRRPERPGCSSHARPWNKFFLNVEANTKKMA